MNSGHVSRTRNPTIGGKNNITQLLLQQSIGQIRPPVLQHSLKDYYMEDLQLSKIKCVKTEPNPKEEIYYLDIDSVMGRYLICCTAKSIAIHDLHTLTDTDDGIKQMFRRVCFTSHRLGNVDTNHMKTAQWCTEDLDSFIVTGYGRILKIFDSHRLTMIKSKRFDRITRSVNTPRRKTVHGLIAVGLESGLLKLVDPRVPDDFKVWTMHCHTKPVTSVQWMNRNEFMFATGSSDHFAALWDIRMHNRRVIKFKRIKGSRDIPIGTTHDGAITGLAFTPEGYHLATFGSDNKFRLWDTWNGGQIDLPFPRLSNIMRYPLNGFSLTKCGKDSYMFIPTGFSVTIFNVFKPEKCKFLYPRSERIYYALYHEQHNQLFTAGASGKILVWSKPSDPEYLDFLQQRIVKNEDDVDDAME